MFYLGLISIVFVPIFKVLTGLQPYVGMMLSLAIVATFAEIYSGTKFKIEENGVVTYYDIPSIIEIEANETDNYNISYL